MSNYRIHVYHDQEDLDNLRSEVPNHSTGNEGTTPKGYIDPEEAPKGRVVCLDDEMATAYEARKGSEGLAYSTSERKNR